MAVNRSVNDALLATNLCRRILDEHNLLVHPIVVGGDLARLFPPDEARSPLKLVKSQTLRSGVLNLTYVRADD
jgi:hypothetical protein